MMIKKAEFKQISVLCWEAAMKTMPEAIIKKADFLIARCLQPPSYKLV